MQARDWSAFADRGAVAGRRIDRVDDRAAVGAAGVGALDVPVPDAVGGDDRVVAAPTTGCGATSQPAAPVAKRATSDGCAAAPPTKPGVSTVTATVGVIFALQ